MEIEKAFGIVIKKYRTNLFISQEKLAEKCGLDRTFISLLERGQRNPTLNTLFKISRSLEIEPYLIVKEVELLTKKGNEV